MSTRERAVAAAAVLVAPLALRLLPLRRAIALADCWPHVAPRLASPEALAQRVHRWLRRGRGPWTPTCLTRAIVLYAMLRQHGHRPTIHLGVAGSSGQFDAHAWVSVDGRCIGDVAPAERGYRELWRHVA